MSSSLRWLLSEEQTRKLLEESILRGEERLALSASYEFRHPNTSETWLLEITSSRTTATKSPRFGPLINHSRLISSILNPNEYWRSESLESCPQWNEVCIARRAEIGWPAYKEGKSVEVVAKGVDRIWIVTAATIYEWLREGEKFKEWKASLHSSTGRPRGYEFLSTCLLQDMGVYERPTAAMASASADIIIQLKIYLCGPQ